MILTASEFVNEVKRIDPKVGESLTLDREPFKYIENDQPRYYDVRCEDALYSRRLDAHVEKLQDEFGSAMSATVVGYYENPVAYHGFVDGNTDLMVQLLGALQKVAALEVFAAAKREILGGA